jgi:hypothetical protein
MKRMKFESLGVVAGTDHLEAGTDRPSRLGRRGVGLVCRKQSGGGY